MTKTDIEKCIADGEMVGLHVHDNRDGSVTYGNTRTFDVNRAAHDLFSLRGS